MATASGIIFDKQEQLGKVVSFVPFSDGFGIHRDAASVKPQMFLTGDGWFAYNLFVNLAPAGKLR